MKQWHWKRYFERSPPLFKGGFETKKLISRKIVYLALSLCFVALMLVFACAAPAPAPTPTPTPAPTPATAPTPTPTPVPTPTQTPVPTPVASFTADKTTVAAGKPVQFTNSSTGVIESWSWNLGDNSTSTEQNPSHSYTKRGNYTVSLTVSNKGGNNTHTLVITVLEQPNADFIASQTKANVSSAVKFTDQSTGDIDSWLWDFGDKSTSTERNPSHTYKDAGTYTVSLTVRNAISSDTKEKKDYVAVSSFIFRRLVMCSNVTDKGEWTPQPDATYRVGDAAWVYFEVIGFTQKKTDDTYEIWVQWTRWRFTDPNGKVMADASDVSEYHKTGPRMIAPFVSFRLNLGKAKSTDPLGEYKVEVTVKDMIGGNTATESTTFILK